ncbi:MAG TPA: response regulator [Candidatus Binataceae bacterium]|nr:response regulator [Candidatus Binataceae bacterium]
MARSDALAVDILLVDDDEDAVSALSLILEFKGYTVATAGNGKQALDYLEHNPPPRLIILDLFMPEMDGWSLCEELRRRPDLSNLRVVVVTAFGKAVKVEADEILPKPLDVENLFAVMDRLMPA